MRYLWQQTFAPARRHRGLHLFSVKTVVASSTNKVQKFAQEWVGQNAYARFATGKEQIGLGLTSSNEGPVASLFDGCPAIARDFTGAYLMSRKALRAL